MRYVPKPIRNCELYEEKDWVLRPPSLTDIKIRLIEELPRYEQKIPLDSIVKGNPLLLHTEITRSYASCPILDVFFIQAMQESLLCVLFLVNGAVTLKAPRGHGKFQSLLGCYIQPIRLIPNPCSLKELQLIWGRPHFSTYLPLRTHWRICFAFLRSWTFSTR